MDVNAYAAALDNRVVRVLLTLIAAIIVQLIAGRFVAVAVRRTVEAHKHGSASDEKKREDTLINVFRTAVGFVVWIVAFIVCLWQLHINVAALLTGAGVVGIALSLGAQSTLKDILAGIFIISENQYRVGDIVTLSAGVSGGVSGVVEELTVRITKLRDLDGKLHIVPNGSAGVISNMTFHFANVVVDIPISYKADVEMVKKLIDQIGDSLAKDDRWSKEIIEPIQFLRVDNLGPAVVTVKALGKVKPGSQWDVGGAFRKELKHAFDKHKITTPSPVVYDVKTA